MMGSTSLCVKFMGFVVLNESNTKVNVQPTQVMNFW
jgi:hypothetical protein